MAKKLSKPEKINYTITITISDEVRSVKVDSDIPRKFTHAELIGYLEQIKLDVYNESIKSNNH